ncbi:hypothetical protein [Bradyrhizobium sp. BR 1432]|uniref:hypothetical protein n=1 Tax=Bradyrhizobium sp. BR 1432 TaxID=3447966 RepID=UPI003EE6E00B
MTFQLNDARLGRLTQFGWRFHTQDGALSSVSVGSLGQWTATIPSRRSSPKKIIEMPEIVRTAD